MLDTSRRLSSDRHCCLHNSVWVDIWSYVCECTGRIECAVTRCFWVSLLFLLHIFQWMSTCICIINDFYMVICLYGIQKNFSEEQCCKRMQIYQKHMHTIEVMMAQQPGWTIKSLINLSFLPFRNSNTNKIRRIIDIKISKKIHIFCGIEPILKNLWISAALWICFHSSEAPNILAFLSCFLYTQK